MDKDYTQFDQQIRNIFDISIKILEEKSRRTNGTNPILRCLRRYISVYSITPREMHVQYFRELFENNANNLLNFFEDEYWLAKQDISIRCGQESNDTKISERSEKRKFQISEIYKISCEMRDSVIQSTKGLPEEHQLKSPELKFPDLFLLYLYRVLRECISNQEDIYDLTEIINVLEEDCGITIGGQTVQQNSVNPFEGILNIGKTLLGGLSGQNGSNNLMNGLTNGLGDGSNGQMFFENITKTLSPLLQNEGIQNLTKEIAPNLQGDNINIAESMGKFLSMVQNPEFLDKTFKTLVSAVPKETIESITTGGQDILQNQILPQLQSNPNLQTPELQSAVELVTKGVQQSLQTISVTKGVQQSSQTIDTNTQL